MKLMKLKFYYRGWTFLKNSTAKHKIIIHNKPKKNLLKIYPKLNKLLVVITLMQQLIRDHLQKKMLRFAMRSFDVKIIILY